MFDAWSHQMYVVAMLAAQTGRPLWTLDNDEAPRGKADNPRASARVSARVSARRSGSCALRSASSRLSHA
jgi:hypothetical protein